ncbi:DUF4124 domain-containing protein, partial [Janthinobacterium agaricidamnosum]
MHRKPITALLAGALLLCTTLAQAQYIWLDDKGLRQYSDHPPAPSVPQKRILKAPGPALPAHDPADDKTGSNAAPPARPAPDWSERNADFNKRRKEAAETAEKASQEATRQASRRSHCQALRDNQTLLESGRRVGITDP